ncbi:MAG: hypothetical protein Q7T03_00130 [Deltaproteobacteria bacterium]|nr:hypothetical protein [Deltaproteobacteria bacterium]
MVTFNDIALGTQSFSTTLMPVVEGSALSVSTTASEGVLSVISSGLPAENTVEGLARRGQLFASAEQVLRTRWIVGLPDAATILAMTRKPDLGHSFASVVAVSSFPESLALVSAGVMLAHTDMAGSAGVGSVGDVPPVAAAVREPRLLTSVEALQKLCAAYPDRPIRMSSLLTGPILDLIGGISMLGVVIYLQHSLGGSNFFADLSKILGGVIILKGIWGLKDLIDARRPANDGGTVSVRGGFTNTYTKYDRRKGTLVTPVATVAEAEAVKKGWVFMNGVTKDSVLYANVESGRLVNERAIPDGSLEDCSFMGTFHGKSFAAIVEDPALQVALRGYLPDTPLWFVCSRDYLGRWVVEKFGPAFKATAASGDMDGQGDGRDSDGESPNDDSPE